MLDLSLWVGQLNGAQTSLKKIGQAVDIPAARKDLKQEPAAFIIPGTDKGGTNGLSGGAVQQEIATTVGVLIAVKNAGGNAGNKHVDELRMVRMQIDGALLGWQPPDACYEVEYVSGRLIGFNDKVLWWMDFYKTAYNKRKV